MTNEQKMAKAGKEALMRKLQEMGAKGSKLASVPTKEMSMYGGKTWSAPDVVKMLGLSKAKKKLQDTDTAFQKKFGMAYKAPKAVAKFGADVATYVPKTVLKSARDIGTIAGTPEYGKGERLARTVVAGIPAGIALGTGAIGRGVASKVAGMARKSLPVTKAVLNKGLPSQIAKSLYYADYPQFTNAGIEAIKGAIKGAGVGGAIGSSGELADVIEKNAPVREAMKRVVGGLGKGALGGALLGGALGGAGAAGKALGKKIQSIKAKNAFQKQMRDEGKAVSNIWKTPDEVLGIKQGGYFSPFGDIKSGKAKIDEKMNSAFRKYLKEKGYKFEKGAPMSWLGDEREKTVIPKIAKKYIGKDMIIDKKKLKYEDIPDVFAKIQKKFNKQDARYYKYEDVNTRKSDTAGAKSDVYEDALNDLAYAFNYPKEYKTVKSDLTPWNRSAYKKVMSVIDKIKKQNAMEKSKIKEGGYFNPFGDIFKGKAGVDEKMQKTFQKYLKKKGVGLNPYVENKYDTKEYKAIERQIDKIDKMKMSELKKDRAPVLADLRKKGFGVQDDIYWKANDLVTKKLKKAKYQKFDKEIANLYKQSDVLEKSLRKPYITLPEDTAQRAKDKILLESEMEDRTINWKDAPDKLAEYLKKYKEADKKYWKAVKKHGEESNDAYDYEAKKDKYLGFIESIQDKFASKK